MSTKGAFSIVLNDTKDKVLLVKRRDYPIWDLPGGRLEGNEHPEECAIRETTEETGYFIMIEKKVGEYDRVHFNDTQYIFLSKIVGGKKIKTGIESSKVMWFNLNKLPLLMVPHRKQQINDFRKGNFPITKKLIDSKRILMIIKLISRLKK
jgi:8-oxo-dGTP pyrophosphatase MutT (NUDIX family)